MNIELQVDATQLKRIIRQLNAKAIPNMIQESVKVMGGELITDVYRPRHMPWDLGRARAGAKRGFQVLKKPYSHIGYTRGLKEGYALSRARLTKKEFKSQNLVPYAGDLDKSHSGRKTALRYDPKRTVLATGPYRGFVEKGLKDTMAKAPKLMKPIVKRHIAPVVNVIVY